MPTTKKAAAAARKTPSPKAMLKKTPAAELGTIEATSAEEAIKLAIDRYGIAPELQSRLAAYP